MYDVSAIKRRYFQVKLSATTSDGKIHTAVVDVKPPKLGVMEKLIDSTREVTSTSDEGENAIKDLRQTVRDMLSNNKTKYKVPEDYIEAMDFDELLGLLNAFFTWMSNTKKASPLPPAART